MGLHRELTPDNIHIAHAFEYADAAARTSATGFVAGDVGKLARQLDDNSLWMLTATTPTWLQLTGSGVGGAVDSVNGQTGAVVLDPDDLDDTTTTHKFTTAANLTKLAGIEAGADVTDAANVAAAGAVMTTATDASGYGFVADEDAMTSNLATKVPTQQSVKAYVDAQVAAGGATYTDEMARDAIGAALVAGSNMTITVNDAGDTITLASTGGGGGGSGSGGEISTPSRPPGWYEANAGNTAAAAVGALPSWNCTVVAANDDDANGPWIKFSTSASSGSAAGAGSSAFWGARRDWASSLIVRDRITDVANVRIWVGLYSANPSGSATPGVHLAGFRFDTGAGDTHWMACTGDASAVTATDTGVTPASGDRPKFEIRLGAASVDFYLNGALVASNTTHLPSGSTDLGYQTWITSLAASVKSIAEGSAVLFPKGGAGGGGSPLTTKGDLYVRDGSGDQRLAVGSNGQVLTADSSQATGVKWAAAGGAADGGPIPGWTSGNYYSHISSNSWGAVAGSALTANTIYAVPIYVPAANTVTELGAQVTAAAASGKVLRLMIFANANGRPGALILDAGTVAADTIGTKGITISQALTAGWVWLACVSDGTPSLYHSTASNGPDFLGQSSAAGTSRNTGLSKAQGVATAPDPFPLSGASGIATLPFLSVKAG